MIVVRALTKSYGRKEVLRGVSFVAQPGESFVYGYGTDILGCVVERASGMALDALIASRITGPLGMVDTHFFLPAGKRERLTAVYSSTEDGGMQRAPEGARGQGHYVDGPRRSFAGGAGLVSTARDYARFLQMLINGGELDGVRLLSPVTVKYMASDHLRADTKFSGVTTLPLGTGFGLGFAVRNDTGRFEVVGNAGEYFWAGAAGTGFYVDPKHGIVCVWMTQGQPGMARRYDRYLFKQMVYQALVK